MKVGQIYYLKIQNTLESSELEKWDPSLLQDFIVNEINEKNKKIIEENKSKNDNKEKLLLIPETLMLLKTGKKYPLCDMN